MGIVPESENAKMPQQSRIDGETSCRWIHTRDVLAFLNIFQRKFRPVVPMTVIQMLANQRMRLDGAVAIDL